MFLCEFAHTFLYLFRSFASVTSNLFSHERFFIIITNDLKCQTSASIVLFQLYFFFYIFLVSLIGRYC